MVLAKSLELLKEDGYLGFVLPKNIIRVDSFKNIRKFLLENTKIVSIVDINAELILKEENFPIVAQLMLESLRIKVDERV